MMPIGNISSRNFWRVRGQKTTAQVINSGGEAESANRASSLHPATTTIAGAAAHVGGKEKKNVSLPCSFFLGMGGTGSRQRTKEEEATIKLGDSIWDTIKKASP